MGGGRPRYPANQREPHHFGFYFDVIGGVKDRRPYVHTSLQSEVAWLA